MFTFAGYVYDARTSVCMTCQVCITGCLLQDRMYATNARLLVSKHILPPFGTLRNTSSPACPIYSSCGKHLSWEARQGPDVSCNHSCLQLVSSATLPPPHAAHLPLVP